jgi:hypothetical protein
MRKLLCLFLVLMLQPACWADASDTGRLIRKIYRSIGPRIGCIFVEPSIVLTLGGYKASNDGWASIAEPQSGDADSVANLSRLILEPQGIRIFPNQQTEDDVVFCEVVSLPALKRQMAGSSIIDREIQPPNDVSAKSWSDCKRAIRQDMTTRYGQEVGGFCQREFYCGLTDAGIEDYAKTLVSKERRVDFRPALGNYFSAPQPIFSLSKAMQGNSELEARMQEWNTFLTEVYDTPEVKEILSSLEFLEARKTAILYHVSWLQKYRSSDFKVDRNPETIRLGLVQP